MAKNGQRFRVIFQPIGYPELVSEPYDFVRGQALQRALAPLASKFIVSTRELDDAQRGHALHIPRRDPYGMRFMVRCWPVRRPQDVAEISANLTPAEVKTLTVIADRHFPERGPPLVVRLLRLIFTPKNSHAQR